MKKIKDHSLYLVTSEECSGGRSTLDIAKEAIGSGIDILQMREKGKSGEDLKKLGREISFLCKGTSTIFIVNDDPYLAKELEADGVHLGQEDINEFPIAETRRIMGKDKVIGISTHSFEQFNIANKEDVDYIAFGPVYPTKTKDYHIGLGDISKVMKVARKPVIFIGGIDMDNIDEVLASGARNIAMIRALTGAKDIRDAIKQVKDKIESRKQ